MDNKKSKVRSGFSLIELVIVILVIAVLALAIFAGGSVVVKKSQVSRTVSDLHNFSIAVESTLNENPSVANIDDADTGAADMKGILAKLNANLPADYVFKGGEEDASLTNTTVGNLTINRTNTNCLVYKSDKKDAWDNPYYLILDAQDTNAANSEFYITIVSAGPDAKTVVGGTIDDDDIFLVGHYLNGDVSAITYNEAESEAQDNTLAAKATTYSVAGTSTTGRTGCPSNFNVPAAASGGG